MSMQAHMLIALREQMHDWQVVLEGAAQERAVMPLAGSDWSLKDVVIHLWAWQQRSLARLEAALNGGQPQFPDWPKQYSPDTDPSVDGLNAWIRDTYKDRTWEQARADWLAGYQRLIELAGRFAQRDLFDDERYPWMDRYPLAAVLTGTYDHHLEHTGQLRAWQKEQGT
ncbi:MAG: hypothetical protein PWQ55_515 [Chloroflexota bacterium]|nr:hypothetical protein [Chloroflexota bacterium]